MAEEIERKFLVRGDAWRAAPFTTLRQGYLSSAKECTVRVRTEGAHASVSVKGETRGATRAEYEYAIPLADAEAMLDTLCERPLIEKRRHRIEHAGLVWEVDEFLGENAGLVVAEVELERADQDLDLPAWVGREVTGDPRYYNSSLVRRPYRTWGSEPEQS